MAEGYKDWAAGNVLTAADLEDYTVKQSVMRFASAAARDTALASVLTEGMVAYLLDTNTWTVYTGSAWVSTGPMHGGGTTWTPTVTQSGSVTVTTNTATYFRLGRLIIAFYDLSVTGSGTGSNDVVISLPVTCRGGMATIGMGEIVDATGPSTYRGVCRTSSTTEFKMSNFGLVSANYGSTTFTAGLASGDTLSGELIFEAAA